MRKKAALFILLSCRLSAQDINFRMTDGTLLTFPLNEVQRLDVVGDSLRMVSASGTIAQWNTNDIGRNDFEGVGPEQVVVAPRLFLDGPFVPGEGMMYDSLRTRHLLPLLEPYSDLGFAHKGCGGHEITLPSVLERSGSQAIVDWIFLELRDLTGAVEHTRSALLRRDGEVVDIDGVSPVIFFAPKGSYRLVAKHRNHLGVAQSGLFAGSNTTTTWDLAFGNDVFGTNPVRQQGLAHTLWCGDVRPDGTVRYTGSANDRDPLLVKVGGITPNRVVQGYLPEDVNMDGEVRYTGTYNDRDRVLLTVGSTTPNNMRQSQYP